MFENNVQQANILGGQIISHLKIFMYTYSVDLIRLTFRQFQNILYKFRRIHEFKHNHIDRYNRQNKMTYPKKTINLHIHDYTFFW